MKTRVRPPPAKSIKSAKHALFVGAYLETGNAAEAARRAGYSDKGGAAAQRGRELLARPEIAEIVNRARDLRCEAEIARGKEVLRELTRVGFSDLSDCADERGQLLPLKQIPEAARRALSKFKVKERPDGSTEVEIALWDKNAALDKLGKFHRLWEEKQEGQGQELSITFVGIAPPLGAPRVQVLAPPSQDVVDALPAGSAEGDTDE